MPDEDPLFGALIVAAEFARLFDDTVVFDRPLAARLGAGTLAVDFDDLGASVFIAVGGFLGFAGMVATLLGLLNDLSLSAIVLDPGAGGFVAGCDSFRIRTELGLDWAFTSTGFCLRSFGTGLPLLLGALLAASKALKIIESGRWVSDFLSVSVARPALLTLSEEVAEELTSRLTFSGTVLLKPGGSAYLFRPLLS